MYTFISAKAQLNKCTFLSFRPSVCPSVLKLISPCFPPVFFTLRHMNLLFIHYAVHYAVQYTVHYAVHYAVYYAVHYALHYAVHYAAH